MLQCWLIPHCIKLGQAVQRIKYNYCISFCKLCCYMAILWAFIYLCSWDTVVSTVNTLQAWWTGVWILAEQQIYLFSKMSRLTMGSTLPPIQWVLGILYSGIKQLECKADHSPSPSVRFKNQYSCTSTSPICLYDMYRDNFTFFTLIHLSFFEVNTRGCSLKNYRSWLLYLFYPSRLDSYQSSNLSEVIPQW